MGAFRVTSLSYLIAVCVLCGGISEPVYAHSQVEGVESFYWGILHPFYELGVVLGLVCLGFLLGQLPPKQGATKLMLAYSGLVTGAILLSIGIPITIPAWLTSSVALVIGILVVWAKRLPNAFYYLLVIAAGVVFPLAVGPDMDSLRENLMVGAGSWLALVLVPVYLIEIVRRLKLHWQQIAIRVIGSWISACCFLMISLEVATQTQ